MDIEEAYKDLYGRHYFDEASGVMKRNNIPRDKNGNVFLNSWVVIEEAPTYNVEPYLSMIPSKYPYLTHVGMVSHPESKSNFEIKFGDDKGFWLTNRLKLRKPTLEDFLEGVVLYPKGTKVDFGDGVIKVLEEDIICKDFKITDGKINTNLKKYIRKYPKLKTL